MIKIELMNNAQLNKELLERLPNPLNLEPKALIRVCPLILELLNKLYIRYPNWTFVLGDKYNLDAINSFKINSEAGEYLGKVEKHYSNQEYKYAITNDRLRKSRNRGSYALTKDLDKAVLIIKKNFYPTTFNERFKTTVNNLNEAMTNGANRKKNETFTMHSRVLESCNKWLEHNFTKFLTFVRQEDLAKYNEICEKMETGNILELELKGVLSVSDALGEEKAYVILDEGTYLVKHNNDNATYTDTTLPDDLRLGMGMLKLAQDKFFVSNIGYRLSDKEFLIIRKKKNETNTI